MSARGWAPRNGRNLPRIICIAGALGGPPVTPSSAIIAAAFLADHDRWCVSTGVQCRRHDRGVGDAQALHPNNAQPRIDHRGRIAAHPAGPTRMEKSRGAGANVVLGRPAYSQLSRASAPLRSDLARNLLARASFHAYAAPSRPNARRSSGSEKYSGKIRGCAVGSLLRNSTRPRLNGRPEPIITVKPWRFKNKIGEAPPDLAAGDQRRRHDKSPLSGFRK